MFGRRTTANRPATPRRSIARDYTAAFEPLEQRLALSGETIPAFDPSLPYRMYFPEGFRSATVDEFVPLVNHNDTAVTFEVIARYEAGDRDERIASGILPATTRGGITTAASWNPAESAISRAGVPYAIEVRSSLPLGGTMSHYDFGVATGEAFTPEISTLWTFAEVQKFPGESLDFITWFNPGTEDALLTITVHPAEGSPVSQVWPLSSLRRGGIDINGEPWVPQGSFSVTIESTQAIVAALSHYEPNTGQGFISLGHPGAGTLDGAIPYVDLSNESEFIATFFNPGDTDATVIIETRFETFDNGRGASAPAGYYDGLDTGPFAFVVPAGRGISLGAADMGIYANERGTLLYESDQPLIVSAATYDFTRADALGMPAATLFWNDWVFADAYIANAGAGTEFIEYLSVYNPSDSQTDVTITLLFVDGTTASFTRTLDNYRGATINLHQEADVLGWGAARTGETWFSIRVESSAPIAASMIHWDIAHDGGWQTLGTPVQAPLI